MHLGQLAVDSSIVELLLQIVKTSCGETTCTKDRGTTFFRGARPWHSSRVAGSVDDLCDPSSPWPAGWPYRGLVFRRFGLLHLRDWPHNRLWRYRAAAGSWPLTCGRNWYLWALPDVP